MSKTFAVLYVVILTTFNMGCSFSSAHLEFNRAQRAESNKEFKTAVKYYNRVIKRTPESEKALIAAKRAAKICTVDLDDFIQAVRLNRFVIVNTKSFEEVKQAQRNIAEIYFSNIQDFQQSINEWNKYLNMRISEEEKVHAREKIAKSYFYLNKFFQSNIELDSLLALELSKDKKFELKSFKGTVLQTLKNYPAAIQVYKEMIKEFPEKSLKQNIHFNLSVCYEETNQHKKAIRLMQELKKVYPDPDYVEHKIFRLKQRQKNLPGARGRVR